MSSKEIKEDFLEADDTIRGQNWVCMSFISPESVLKNKEIFKVQEFLKALVKKNNINLSQEYIDNLEEKYKDFLFNSDDALEDEFSKRNDYRCTVRGVKVRGVYDSYKEAELRASLLQKKDKNFNVFVGQVGYWLPWDPTPHKVGESKYFESELNELVKKYKENQRDKETHFRENVEYVKSQASEKAKREKEAQKKSAEQESEDLKQSFEAEDPWMARKNQQAEESVNDTDDSKTL